MCGRFTLTASFEELISRFNIEAWMAEELYEASYNIAPTQSVIAVINDGKKNRLGQLRWGLIPPWAKDEKIGYKMINARAETLTEKPSFRIAFQKRRCLIVADSFYEWKRDGDYKTPMRIRLKSDKPFGMAGLWEAWKTWNGEKIFSGTVITTEPNGLMSRIHDRMPVILQPNDEKTWLNPGETDMNKLSKLLKPYNEEWMEAYEVSNLVNSPKNNSIHLIQEK